MNRNILVILGALGLFLAGLIAGSAVGPVQFDENIPAGYTIQENVNELADSLNPLSTGSASEKPSPSDWVKESQIEVYSDRIILDIKNAQWAIFTDTNSMDPIIDEHSSAIELVPASEDQINVGDIVSYKSEYATGTIIHRVVYKGEDEYGTYFIMKGDNNPSSDPGRIRFSQIERVLIAIIY